MINSCSKIWADMKQIKYNIYEVSHQLVECNTDRFDELIRRLKKLRKDYDKLDKEWRK